MFRTAGCIGICLLLTGAAQAYFVVEGDGADSNYMVPFAWINCSHSESQYCLPAALMPAADQEITGFGWYSDSICYAILDVWLLETAEGCPDLCDPLETMDKGTLVFSGYFIGLPPHGQYYTANFNVVPSFTYHAGMNLVVQVCGTG
ncbi:hypothetical protein JW905_13965, partial [bacterium]|nr:hypothetical protein [candidate division CSSED10-310 bacterium]